MWRHAVGSAALAAAIIATQAAPAMALLSLAVGSGATLSPFRPGQTATGSGALTVTTVLPWTLTVSDGGTGAGHMVKSAAGCTGSSAQLTNALSVTVTSAASGFTSAGAKSISASATPVASGSTALLVATVLATNYAQIIPATQVLLTGCVYTLTATYTLQ